jgi:hypothetical protein
MSPSGNAIACSRYLIAETVAGNSVSQRECGFDPDVDPEALTKAQKELNQSNPG